jgi:hypothetical protein
MSDIFMILMYSLFGCSLLPAILLALAQIVKGGQWVSRSDWLTFLVPGPIWFLLMYTNMKSKSLSNLIEVMIIQVAMVVLVLAVILIRSKQTKWYHSWHGLIVAAIIALGVYVIVPCLPE